MSARFYYRLVFRDSNVVDCAVLKDVNLTARQVLRHRASDQKLNKLERQQRGNVNEWARINAELKGELEAAKEGIARNGGDLQGKDQRTECGTADTGLSNGSREEPGLEWLSEGENPSLQRKEVECL